MTISNTRRQKLPTGTATQSAVTTAYLRGVSVEIASPQFGKQLLFACVFVLATFALPALASAMSICESNSFFNLDSLQRNAAEGMSVHRHASLDVNIAKVLEDVAKGAAGRFPSQFTAETELVGAVQFYRSEPKVHVRYRLIGNGEAARFSLVGIEVRNGAGEVVLKSASPVDPKTGQLRPDVEINYAVRAVRRRLFLNYDVAVTRFIVENAHWLSLATRQDLQLVTRESWSGRDSAAGLSQILRYRELQRKLATPQGQLLVRILKLGAVGLAFTFLSSFTLDANALVVDGLPGIWVHDPSSGKVVFLDMPPGEGANSRSPIVHEVPTASDEYQTIIQTLNEISLKKSHPRGVES